MGPTGRKLFWRSVGWGQLVVALAVVSVSGEEVNYLEPAVTDDQKQLATIASPTTTSTENDRADYYAKNEGGEPSTDVMEERSMMNVQGMGIPPNGPIKFNNQFYNNWSPQPQQARNLMQPGLSAPITNWQPLPNQFGFINGRNANGNNNNYYYNTGLPQPSPWPFVFNQGNNFPTAAVNNGAARAAEPVIPTPGIAGETQAPRDNDDKREHFPPGKVGHLPEKNFYRSNEQISPPKHYLRPHKEKDDPSFRQNFNDDNKVRLTKEQDILPYDDYKKPGIKGVTKNKDGSQFTKPTAAGGWSDEDEEDKPRNNFYSFNGKTALNEPKQESKGYYPKTSGEDDDPPRFRDSDEDRYDKTAEEEDYSSDEEDYSDESEEEDENESKPGYWEPAARYNQKSRPPLEQPPPRPPSPTPVYRGHHQDLAPRPKPNTYAKPIPKPTPAARTPIKGTHFEYGSRPPHQERTVMHRPSKQSRAQEHTGAVPLRPGPVAGGGGTAPAYSYKTVRTGSPPSSHPQHRPQSHPHPQHRPQSHPHPQHRPQSHPHPQHRPQSHPHPQYRPQSHPHPQHRSQSHSHPQHRPHQPISQHRSPSQGKLMHAVPPPKSSYRNAVGTVRPYNNRPITGESMQYTVTELPRQQSYAPTRMCLRIDKKLNPTVSGNKGNKRVTCYTCVNADTGDEYEQCSMNSEMEPESFIKASGQSERSSTARKPLGGRRAKRSPADYPLRNIEKREDKFRFNPKHFQEKKRIYRPSSNLPLEEGESCDKVRRDSAVCIVCKNSITGGSYEQCSFASDPKKNSYERTSERVYGDDELPKGYRDDRPRRQHRKSSGEEAESKGIESDPDYSEEDPERYEDGSAEDTEARSPQSERSTNRRSAGNKSTQTGGKYEAVSKRADGKNRKTSGESDYDNDDDEDEDDDGEGERKSYRQEHLTSDTESYDETPEPVRHETPLKGKVESIERYNKGISARYDPPVGLDPFFYGRPNQKDVAQENNKRQDESDDDEEAGDRRDKSEPEEIDSQENNNPTYEDYFYKLFPELAERRGRGSLPGYPIPDSEEYDYGGGNSRENDSGGSEEEAEGDEEEEESEASVPNSKVVLPRIDEDDDFNIDQNRKILEKAINAMSRKDRSECKKVYKDKMTCYRCVDDQGNHHEECMMVASTDRDRNKNELKYKERTTGKNSRSDGPADERSGKKGKNPKKYANGGKSGSDKKDKRAVGATSEKKRSARSVVDERRPPVATSRTARIDRIVSSPRGTEKNVARTSGTKSVSSNGRNNNNNNKYNANKKRDVVNRDLEFDNNAKGVYDDAKLSERAHLPDGAFSDLTKPVYDEHYKMALPRFMIEKSPIEAEFDESVNAG